MNVVVSYSRKDFKTSIIWMGAQQIENATTCEGEKISFSVCGKNFIKKIQKVLEFHMFMCILRDVNISTWARFSTPTFKSGQKRF